MPPWMYLERARASYLAAGSTVGLADIQTNTAELLSLIDPAAAVEAAHDAISRQRDIGADHELGKAYSALGLAHIALGELDAADHALIEAVAAFERAAYRSGRARAELYRAVWLVRRGRLDEALTAIRWAVTEFQAAEVYPTLVIAGTRLAQRIGLAGAGAGGRRGRRRALSPTTTKRHRPRSTHRQRSRPLLADRLSERYAAALNDDGGAAGFYNHNVRVGDDLVRIPMPESATMDTSSSPEHLVLAAVGRHLTSVPRLRAVCVDPRFQVHEYIEGDVVDVIAPRGVRVPDGLIEHVADFFGSLASVLPEDLPPVPADWPVDGDCVEFARRLSTVTATVHREYWAEFGWLWQQLGFPSNPLEPIDWFLSRPRAFRLVHADVHRKNMIHTSDGGFVILDWELALWGDPLYDLVSHLHKMGYLPDEEARTRRSWAARQPPEVLSGWSEDLNRYLRHERVKSAIVDSVRYFQVLAEPTTTPEKAEALIANLTTKIAWAREAWGDDRPPDIAEVRRALRAS